jgi:hypothetical protein
MCFPCLQHFAFEQIQEKQTWEASSPASLKQEVFPFLLFAFTSSCFIYILGDKFWPPPGDGMSGIDPLVSLIERALIGRWLTFEDDNRTALTRYTICW